MRELQSHSGPLVATTFHRLLALVFLLAWSSLLWQIDVLIGSRGLLPIADLIDPAAKRVVVEFASFPTLLLWNASDAALHAGIWGGIVVSLVWLTGTLPRLCAIASALLYLSYATAARDFLHFQWDNMIIECGVLAALLPVDRPARWIHFLFRVLLFKLYFESGIAKWQSYLGDWHDGSAMAYYYETAPIPTWIGWYAHALPGWWHSLESRLVLVLELAVPFAIFAPRRGRLLCALALTGFQLVNIATANYGFFCYLSLALHVFLLDDRDLARFAGAGHRRHLAPGRWGELARRMTAACLIAAYLSISTLEGIYAFARPSHPPPELTALRRIYTPFRAVNTYHLFGHITRERIEPELQWFDGTQWHALEFLYKPGAPDRRPPFVAPHQPRVDFRLWFYGLSYRRGTPAYVQALIQKICHEPDPVAGLFTHPLKVPPQSLRLVFWRYRFTNHPGDTDWWQREKVAESGAIDCS